MYFLSLQDNQLQKLVEAEGFVRHAHLPLSFLNGQEGTMFLDVGVATIYRNACWQNFLNFPLNPEIAAVMKKAHTIIIPLGFKYYNRGFTLPRFNKLIARYPNGFMQEWKKTFGLMIIKNGKAFYYDIQYTKPSEQLIKKRKRTGKKHENRQRQASNTLLRRLNTKVFQARPISFHGLPMEEHCPVQNASSCMLLFNLRRFLAGTDLSELGNYAGFKEVVTYVARRSQNFNWKGVYGTVPLHHYKHILSTTGVHPDLPALPFEPDWF